MRHGKLIFEADATRNQLVEALLGGRRLEAFVGAGYAGRRNRLLARTLSVPPDGGATLVLLWQPPG